MADLGIPGVPLEDLEEGQQTKRRCPGPRVERIALMMSKSALAGSSYFL